MTNVASTFAKAVRGYAHHRKVKAALPVLDPAQKLVRSDRSEEDARRELVAVVQANPAAARIAMNLTERSIDPVTDRAYRLIRAAVDQAPVQPVDPAKEADLREYEHWSTIPIGDAFRDLEALVPGLAALGAKAEAWAAAHPSPEPEQEALQSLTTASKVGRLLSKAPGRDELVVRSDLARRIALTYLQIARGDDSRGDASRAYAEIAATPITVSVTGPLRRPPDQ
jgi:hypothetical protein